MASANLELVRSIFADWERGDFGRTAGLHPDIAWAYVGGPEPGSGTGMAGMAAPMRDWLHAWNEWRIEATDYRELDGERILVFCRGVGRGKTSGLDLGQLATDGANLFEVHDGKVTRLVIYWDRERALADLGLAPASDAPS
jgi:ketosteroid isomerase-like protein